MSRENNKLIIVNVEQGSDEWFELRRTKRAASETPAIMGTSKWVTAADVYDTKVDGKRSEDNVAMAHGRRLEEAARSALEIELCMIGFPMVGYRGDYLASVDWLSADGKMMVEVKCPFTGARSETWRAAQEARIEPGYADQIAHQRHVFRPLHAFLFVYIDDDNHVLVRHPSESPKRWAEIEAAWDKFWVSHIVPKVRPTAYEQREDDDWRSAAADFVEAVRESEQAEAAVEKCRARLRELAAGRKVSGSGVRVSTIMKSGQIDYKAAVAAAGIDAEPYRKPGREETRVELIKEKAQ